MKKNKIVLALLACGFILGTNAYAALATGNMNVSANILGDCEIVANDLDFGGVILGTGSVSSTTIDVTCPAEVSGYLRINGGQNEAGSARNLSQTISGTPYYVQYNLYSDASMTQPFSTLVSGGFGGVSISGTGAVQAIEVHGEIPVQASQPAGAYTDTLEVAIDY